MLQQAHTKQQPTSIVPFLKWAGGKRWAVKQILQLIPENFNVYYEPFLGSGAIYFSLKPNAAVLSDLNKDLINAYVSVRDEIDKVEIELRRHHRKHCKEHYYETRAKLLRLKHTRAAQFIYLNRTCWNGLYRVNLSGAFNVPIGTKTSVLLDSDDFSAASEILKSAEILSQDFEVVIEAAGERDVIFADPPYTIHHNTNGFIKYNEKIFSWEDQIRLRNALVRAKGRGAKVIMTNANHESVRELYKSGFILTPLSRMSIIAGAASARKSYEELLIVSN